MGSIQDDGSPNISIDFIGMDNSDAVCLDKIEVDNRGGNHSLETRVQSDDIDISDGGFEAKRYKLRQVKKNKKEYEKMRSKISNDGLPLIQTLRIDENDTEDTVNLSFEVEQTDQTHLDSNHKKCSTKWSEIFNSNKRVTIHKKSKKINPFIRKYKSEEDPNYKNRNKEGYDFIVSPPNKNVVNLTQNLPQKIFKNNHQSTSYQKQSSSYPADINKHKVNQEDHHQTQEDHRLPIVSNSLSTLYASRKVLPLNSEFAVLKLVNISWNLGISDIVSYFSSVKLAIGHQPPHYTHTIHIIMNRDTGKTHSECFIEFPTYYDALTAMEMHPRGVLKGRMVTAQWSSQYELFNLLFPNQTVFTSEKYINHVRQPHYALNNQISYNQLTSDDSKSITAQKLSSQKLGVFLQREEINAILVICRNYKLHFSRKCAERPFENIISVITKIPWDNYNLISPSHRDHLFEMIKLGLDSLKIHLEKCDVSMDSTLFTRMLRAGLCAPLFTERQKKTLLSVTGMECPPDMSQFVYTSSNDKCPDSLRIPSSKQLQSQISIQDSNSPKSPLSSPSSNPFHHKKCDHNYLKGPQINDYTLQYDGVEDNKTARDSLINCPNTQILFENTSSNLDRRPDFYYGTSPTYHNIYIKHYNPALDVPKSNVMEPRKKLPPQNSDSNNSYNISNQTQNVSLVLANSIPSNHPIIKPIPGENSLDKYENMRLETSALLSKIESLEFKLRKSHDLCDELLKRSNIAENNLSIDPRAHSNIVNSLEMRCKELESTLFTKERSNIQLELRLRKIQEIITRHAENFNVSQDLRAEIETQTITGPWGGFLGGNNILFEGVKDLWDK